MKIKIYTDENKQKMKDYVKTVRFNLTPNNPGGEEVSLEVDYFKNDEGDVYHNISLKNSCYGAHESKISYYSLGLDTLAEAITAAQKIGNVLNDAELAQQGAEPKVVDWFPRPRNPNHKPKSKKK